MDGSYTDEAQDSITMPHLVPMGMSLYLSEQRFLGQGLSMARPHEMVEKAMKAAASSVPSR